MTVGVKVLKIYLKGEEIEIGDDDIFVIVGPNSSGKSQLLKDIIHISKNNKEKKKVIDNIDYKYIGSEQEFLSFLESISILSSRQYSGLGWSIHTNYIRVWGQGDNVHNFADLFIKNLDTKSRLGIADSPKSISRSEQSTHIFHEFYTNKNKLESFNKYFFSTFKKYLINDNMGGSETAFYTYHEKQDLTNISFDELQNRINNSVVKLGIKTDEEGDGVKSFIGVVGSCISGLHTVLCIDEPESFLHPPQAEILGGIVHEISFGKQLFLATHSSSFLKGLLDSNIDRLKILRMVRDGDETKLKLLSNDKIKELFEDPLIRYSNIMDGLFNHKVIICEGDADCMFYKAIFDQLQKASPTVDYGSILFVHTATKDRMHKIATVLVGLGIDVRIIADIDILRQDAFPTLRLTLESLGGSIDDILDEITTINTRYSRKSANTKYRKTLKRKGGVNALQSIGSKSGVSFKKFENVFSRSIDFLKNNRIFVVPIGELEAFDPSINSHGPKRLVKAIDKDLSTNQLALEFIRKVVE